MTFLARLGEDLPERYYLGVDIGYKAHVAVVVSLNSFVEEGSLSRIPKHPGRLRKAAAISGRVQSQSHHFLGAV